MAVSRSKRNTLRMSGDFLVHHLSWGYAILKEAVF